ncbi:MAG: serine hydrolase [Acidobacteriaceae bacterium]
MRLRRLFLCVVSVTLLVTVTLPVMGQPSNVAASIDRLIQTKIHGFRGNVSLYARNLDTGVSYGLHADDPVPTASTIKLPIMIELFALAKEGKLNWNQKLTLTDQDMVSGSGVLQYLSAGDQFTLRDLMHLMIDFSDNTATNLLLDRIGGNAVNARMAKLGLKETAVMHDIMEPKIFPAANPNTRPVGLTDEGAKPGNAKWGTGRSSPRDMVILLEKLYRGELVSKSASDEMIAVLKRQQFHDIGRDMPGTVIASKSGALDHLRSDVAIVYSKHGPIAMAITVNNMPEVNYREDNPGEILISQLSDILVEALVTPPVGQAAR